MMNAKLNLSLLLTAGLIMSPAVYADDETEDTMTVVEEGQTPEDVVHTLALPEDASDQARESAAFGLDTANRAREDGRAFGQEMAERARGGDVGEQIRETVGDARSDQRDRRPDEPGQPDVDDLRPDPSTP